MGYIKFINPFYSFSSGPIFGKYMYKLGVRRVYFFGVFQTAACALLFGTLDFIQDKTTFLVRLTLFILAKNSFYHSFSKKSTLNMFSQQVKKFSSQPFI